MLSDEMDAEIYAGEACSWPTDQDGKPVRTVPAERFELYVFAKLRPTPTGLHPAPMLEVEKLIRDKIPSLFRLGI